MIIAIDAADDPLGAGFNLDRIGEGVHIIRLKRIFKIVAFVAVFLVQIQAGVVAFLTDGIALVALGAAQLKGKNKLLLFLFKSAAVVCRPVEAASQAAAVVESAVFLEQVAQWNLVGGVGRSFIIAAKAAEGKGGGQAVVGVDIIESPDGASGAVGVAPRISVLVEDAEGIVAGILPVELRIAIAGPGGPGAGAGVEPEPAAGHTQVEAAPVEAGANAGVH